MDHKYFFAIGQRSFEINDRFFSTLIPIADSYGKLIDNPRADFPNRGRVWWMVRGDSRVTYAPPGCLVLAGIEHAIEFSNDPNKDRYQSLQPILPRPNDLIEILTPQASITDPNDLLDGFSMRCNHEPTRFVLVRLGNNLYGPLKIELGGPENQRDLQPEIRFSKPAAPHKVYRIDGPLSPQRHGCLAHSVYVSPTDRLLGDQEGHRVDYEAVTGAQFEELREQGEEIELVATHDAIRQLASAFLTRKKRQEFVAQFANFVEQSDVSPAALRRGRQILLRETEQLDYLNDFFDGLLSDEAFKPRIEAAVKAKVDHRVNELAAQIDARAQERIRELTQKRSDLDTQIKEEEARFQRDMTFHQREFEEELRQLRVENEAEINRKIEELEQLEEIVTGSLQTVADRLMTERGALINEYLALEPLLQRLVLRTDSDSEKDASEPAEAYKSPAPSLRLPDISLRKPRTVELTEEAFFERLTSHVEECGFKFDTDDLLAFHLSAKERAPVILGGVSGTGKSSLPVLYSEALAGEEDMPHFLAVDVNPSWMSPADLLGYTDALEHRFVPSPPGLYHQLILAAHEHTQLGSDAEIHTVCLDEMNLAQPEYYLADVIQALSRSPGQQSIRVFDPGAVRPEDPYRAHARIELTPNLLLFGTVNFDETTRPMSLRLLDRCNFIEFRPVDTLPSLTTEASTGQRSVPGPAVRQADLQRWTRNTAVLPLVVEVLDAIQPELRRLGSPITPRRQSSILRFVANAPASLCNPDRAIDMQLRQRVLPQLRGLYWPGALEAVRQLSAHLERRCNVPRTLDALAQFERRERELNDSFVLSEE